MSPVLCLTEHQCAGVQIRKVIPRASWASWLYACFYIYMDDVKGSRNPAASMKPVTMVFSHLSSSLKSRGARPVDITSLSDPLETSRLTHGRSLRACKSLTASPSDHTS